jgi:leucyl aminopeptidase
MGTSFEPGIVIGAHMDTLSANDYRSKHSIKPGADDDGSGTVTVLEVARILFASGMHFNKPIYFIWYAAEERGLVGSDYVVADFKKKNIPISAVIQLDMTGYSYQNDPTMWLISDYVDPGLTAFLETLITTYIKQPVKYTRCGYACSDHATWTQNGYPAAMPSEAAFQNFNHDIHTSGDTMDKLSLDHMINYAKLTIAFAVELAELHDNMHLHTLFVKV